MGVVIHSPASHLPLFISIGIEELHVPCVLVLPNMARHHP